MRILCPCGSVIVDDGLPNQHKAHLRPDLSDSRFSGALIREAETIARDYRTAGRTGDEALKRALEEFGMVGVHLERALYECSDCGRLLVMLPGGRMATYVPETPTRGVLGDATP